MFSFLCMLNIIFICNPVHSCRSCQLTDRLYPQGNPSDKHNTTHKWTRMGKFNMKNIFKIWILMICCFCVRLKVFVSFSFSDLNSLNWTLKFRYLFLHSMDDFKSRSLLIHFKWQLMNVHRRYVLLDYMF